MTWHWVRADVVFALHDRQIAEHNGVAGVRDRGAVLSALARPCNMAEYGSPDVAALAAAYAFGLARTHGFVDGNKRVAWVTARVFLRLNGAALRCAAQDAVAVMLALAAGELDEVGMAGWIRDRIEIV